MEIENNSWRLKVPTLIFKPLVFQLVSDFVPTGHCLETILVITVRNGGRVLLASSEQRP